ncbi:shikimate kinase 1, chloroplastic-like isoform X1 [Diospyros lotus]|uniref:shikimate kinase 1, chloroplastic-like isoform X1 n=2 Tax=Diospyros lotus TaxID=55363 RepID=UPI0022502E9A|nr:shikimate kinase 1, chloroplastic-like isoform X1 [Diospyros lotus]
MGLPMTQRVFRGSDTKCWKSEALRNLSLMPRQVVATGGGAVVRDINWKYMKKGLTVYLQVPLDTLARRIAAVGMDSRPLLDFGSGDAYTKIFMNLFTLSKKRRQAYSNADVTVSLQHIATQEGLEDLSNITPSAIALEVLVQIQGFLLRNEREMSI